MVIVGNSPSTCKLYPLQNPPLCQHHTLYYHNIYKNIDAIYKLALLFGCTNQGTNLCQGSHHGENSLNADIVHQ